MLKKPKKNKYDFEQGEKVWFKGSPGGGLKPGIYYYELETPGFDGYDNQGYVLISNTSTSTSNIYRINLDGSTSKKKITRRHTWSVLRTEIRKPTKTELILFDK